MNWQKGICGAVLAGTLLSAGPAWGAGIYYDGEAVAVDVAPVVVEGRTLVPLKMLEQMGDVVVDWQEERQTLSLQGEPVLEYALVRPQIRDGGRGGRRLDRYYQHLAEVWRRRWSRALYWHACLDLARCREQSHPFHPWQAHLEGRVLFQDQDSLSIRLDAEEVHGDGRPLRVRMGDVWSLPEGVPLPAGACFPGDRRWWLHLTRKLREQGEVRRAAGDCFLDPDFGPRLRQFLSPHRYCRTPEGLEFYVPQCALAPAAEGVVAFSLPLERK